jgi:hypothetical protein
MIETATSNRSLRQTLGSTANRLTGDAVLACRLACVQRRDLVLPPHLPDDCYTRHGPAVMLPACRSAPPDPVCYILGMSAKAQVSRVDAQRVVASVPYDAPRKIEQEPVRKRIGYPASVVLFPSYTEGAILSVVLSSTPQPATTRGRGDVPPETLCGVLHSLLYFSYHMSVHGTKRSWSKKSPRVSGFGTTDS